MKLMKRLKKRFITSGLKIYIPIGTKSVARRYRERLDFACGIMDLMTSLCFAFFGFFFYTSLDIYRLFMVIEHSDRWYFDDLRGAEELPLTSGSGRFDTRISSGRLQPVDELGGVHDVKASERLLKVDGSGLSGDLGGRARLLSVLSGSSADGDGIIGEERIDLETGLPVGYSGGPCDDSDMFEEELDLLAIPDAAFDEYNTPHDEAEALLAEELLDEGYYVDGEAVVRESKRMTASEHKFDNKPSIGDEGKGAVLL